MATALAAPTRRGQEVPGALEYWPALTDGWLALLEEEYIFNWLAWDGDNILASGAILDYGSHPAVRRQA